MNQSRFEDFKVNTKIKLSALWTAVMFCYVYGDFFTLFVPGRIENLMAGNSGAGETTPIKLLMFAILMTLPSVMIFLSLILKPKVNRWANILVGLFFTAIMILVTAASISEWMIFYIYLAVVEIILTSLVVWNAWMWPKHQPV
ncbi:MAG: DUF6326 family protein [Flammeovirgaceae bacterium]|nr:DUF6326 family protein [Flammeovirgaceae bacterium]